MSDYLLSFRKLFWPALASLFISPQALAHGGVSLEGDQCIIQIDFFRAHFTVYQPETRANREYCEDIPDVTASVFVLDYLHKSLADMPVDFRIIRDIDKFGRFARWEQIDQIENIEDVTVFYQAPVKRPDAVFTVEHEFDEPGNYIGIVTTKQDGYNKVYRAMFPFEVGSTGLGYLPVIVGLIVLVQVNYWIMSGGLARWRARRRDQPVAES